MMQLLDQLEKIKYILAIINEIIIFSNMMEKHKQLVHIDRVSWLIKQYFHKRCAKTAAALSNPLAVILLSSACCFAILLTFSNIPVPGMI